jgi:hypothetical protein
MVGVYRGSLIRLYGWFGWLVGWLVGWMVGGLVGLFLLLPFGAQGIREKIRFTSVA